MFRSFFSTTPITASTRVWYPPRIKVAVTHGPLVYCLESIDNSNIDIFNATLDSSSLTETFESELLGGIVKLNAQTTDAKSLIFVPYHLWGNRGVLEMTVWVNA